MLSRFVVVALILSFTCQPVLGQSRPTLDSVTPDAVVVAAPATIVLRGGGFSTHARVHIRTEDGVMVGDYGRADEPADGSWRFRYVDDTQLEVEFTPGMAGTYEIAVVDDGEASSHLSFRVEMLQLEGGNDAWIRR